MPDKTIHMRILRAILDIFREFVRIVKENLNSNQMDKKTNFSFWHQKAHVSRERQCGKLLKIHENNRDSRARPQKNVPKKTKKTIPKKTKKNNQKKIIYRAKPVDPMWYE